MVPSLSIIISLPPCTPSFPTYKHAMMSVYLKTKRTLTLHALPAIALLLCLKQNHWLSILSSIPLLLFSLEPILLVKVTNDYRINKSNSLFLVLISPSTVFIIWLSMTILDSSPISEVGNHFLSEFRRHCYTYLFYMGNPRAWMLVPFSISSLTALNKNLGVISVWMVSPVPISPLNSRLIY